MIIAIKKFVVQFAHNFYHQMKFMMLQKDFSKTLIHILSIIEKNIVIHSSIVGNKCIAWILIVDGFTTRMCAIELILKFEHKYYLMTLFSHLQNIILPFWIFISYISIQQYVYIRGINQQFVGKIIVNSCIKATYNLHYYKKILDGC